MSSALPTSSARRIGLSRNQKPSRLLGNIRGRETSPPLRSKAPGIKQPTAIDAPPLSSGDEDDGPAKGVSSEAVEPPGSLKLPEVDSSDNSSDGRTASASIKPTKFGSSSQKDSTLAASNLEVAPNQRSGSNKRRKVNDGANDAKSPPSSLGGKGTASEPNSSASHMTDDFGFFKAKGGKGNAKTYAQQKPRKTFKAAKEKPASKPGIQVPDGFISPQKPKPKSIRLPSVSDGSPVKEAPAALKTNWDSEEAAEDASSGPKERLGDSPPLRKGARSKRAQARKKRTRARSSSPPPAVFKLPDDLPEPQQRVLNGEGPADVPSSDFDSTGDEAAIGKEQPSKEEDDKVQETLCPWCGDLVDPAMLKEFSKGKRLNVRMQTKFCRKHKKITAMESWHARRYPKVEWESLETRFADHDELLLGIVNGAPSHFKAILAEKIHSGKERSLKKEENMNPGYYGPRGFNLMCDYLVAKFGDLLKERAVSDRTIAGRGSAAFIQSVLVAELAVQLIAADMGVPVEEARVVMEESKALGEMVHDEG